MKLALVAVIATLVGATSADVLVASEPEVTQAGVVNRDNLSRREATSGQRADPWPCPEESLYSQPSMTGADAWSAFTSAIAPDGTFDYTGFENFPPISGEICDIHWYGLSLLWNNGWFSCDPAGMVFELAFYSPGPLPQPITCGPYTVTPTSTPVETLYDVYVLHYFQIPSLVPECWCLSGGWVSIKSIGADNDCVFLWMTAPATYDNQSYQLDAGTYTPTGFDLAFCLACLPDWVWGCCCDDYSATCMDSYELLDCLGHGWRFQSWTLCEDLVPPCGFATGACCYDDGGCCLTTIVGCGQVGDVNCDGVIDFSDIGPFVDVLSGDPGCNACQADCNRDGAVTFDDINPFVDILSGLASPSGSFIGIDSTCADCPCVVPCPAGATPEGEACHAQTNDGCNVTPHAFGSIACGEAICGTAWFDGTVRDTDWFRLDSTAQYVVTLSGAAEFDLQLLLIRDPGADCTQWEYWYIWTSPCEYAAVESAHCLPAGTIYAWVGPQLTTAFDCTEGNPQYWVHLECEPCTIPMGACCKDDICYPNLTHGECIAMGGCCWFEGLGCDPNPCPGPPQQGEDCTDPFVVTEPLPFTDTDDTCYWADDYVEICPFDAPYSPDVAYRYTPSADVLVDVSLCFDHTDYDTRLYVYEGQCPGALLACNDDYCTTASYPYPYVSQVGNVQLYAGATYYIIVDGYGGTCGSYHLEVSSP